MFGLANNIPAGLCETHCPSTGADGGMLLVTAKLIVLYLVYKK